MGLTLYRQKRDFNQTPEPQGKEQASQQQLIYIIQKHAASHLHYDFRLEWQGVLKSWAIPKGPSYDPAEKRLAVEVEDHPLEYADFEGIIPQDQYGGGTVMLWDRGHWEPVTDPDEGLHTGKLVFRLHGEKLQGEWTLLRMRGASAKPNWLLIKKTDALARRQNDTTLLATLSVKTGRSLEAIAASEGFQKH